MAVSWLSTRSVSSDEVSTSTTSATDRTPHPKTSEELIQSKATTVQNHSTVGPYYGFCVNKEQYDIDGRKHWHFDRSLASLQSSYESTHTVQTHNAHNTLGWHPLSCLFCRRSTHRIPGSMQCSPAVLRIYWFCYESGHSIEHFRWSRVPLHRNV